MLSPSLNSTLGFIHNLSTCEQNTGRKAMLCYISSGVASDVFQAPYFVPIMRSEGAYSQRWGYEGKIPLSVLASKLR
jgi:hypothetical protein